MNKVKQMEEFEELELTHKPIEGLFSYSLSKGKRDATMRNHAELGFEVQPWKATINGLTYYGFSYSRLRRLTQKQKREFKLKRKL